MRTRAKDYSSDPAVRAQQRGDNIMMLFIFVVRFILFLLAVWMLHHGQDWSLVLAAFILALLTPPGQVR